MATFLILAFWAFILAYISPPEERDNSVHPPNLILILVDDAGYDDFGFTDCPDWQTPVIDSLALAGVIFNNAYVSASVCGPSRAGLITGRYQQSFGIEENLTGQSINPVAPEDYGLPLNIPTLGTLLKKKGYTTAAIGKWHLGEYEHFHPNNRGFDYFYGFLGGHRSYWPIAGEPLPGPATLLENKELSHTPEYLTDQLGHQSARFIAENKNKPFFIYLAYNAVHSPLDSKKEDRQALSTIHSEKRRILGAMTIALDRSVGFLVDELKKQGLYENTLIVFTNDNGAATYLETNNAGMRGRKGTVWEGGIRVPFFMTWPGKIPGGQIDSSLVSTLDIASTFCSIAGYSPGEMKELQLTGMDLLMSSDSQDRELPLFWKRGNMAAVRKGPWKLILLNDNPAFLLNLSKDPLEKVIQLAIYPDKVQELQSEFNTWKDKNPEPIWIKTSWNVYAQNVLKYWDQENSNNIIE